jgi:hypothetical protein
MTRRPVTVPPDVPGALGRAMTVVGELGVTCRSSAAWCVGPATCVTLDR